MAEEETKESLHVTGANAADTEAAAGVSEGGEQQQQTGGKPRPEPGKEGFSSIRNIHLFPITKYPSNLHHYCPKFAFIPNPPPTPPLIPPNPLTNKLPQQPGSALLGSYGNSIGSTVQSGLSPVGKPLGKGLETVASPVGGLVEPLVGGIMKSGKGFGDTVG
ncbi:MAG: hypothetical protein Q9184_008591, partial [Pyrenodesmia sp. 2 TL-2023]